jgi:predicted ATPase
MQLFADRAMAVAPQFRMSDHTAAVADVCRQLDGIPLAIELAAARITALTPEQIAERVSDRFRLLVSGSRTAARRQQTLRATMDWSYELLTQPERTLFNRLSVFAGGCSLEAAEVVCADAEQPSQICGPDVLDLVAHLVDRSLAVAEPIGTTTRYDDFRSALSWALGNPQDSEPLLRLAGAPYPLWWHHDHLTEGRAWLAYALDRDADPSKCTLSGRLA